ncbi:MAG: penicillin-binding protein 2 [Novosphingobium sp.]|nr:penicillin-binding protein 2 [Novosphingobium sp.]
MTAISVSRTITAGRHQLVNVRQRSLLVAKQRVLLVLLLFAVLAACALIRLAALGLFEPATGRSRAAAEALLPVRGDIVDRNGVPLARAFQAYALWYNPDALGGGTPLVKSPGEVAAALSRVFPDIDRDEIEARLASGKPGYLRRRILPEDANRIHELGEPALEFPRENERFYPQGSMAAHILGFVSADGQGRVGMEQVFDEKLTDPMSRGTPAVLSVDLRVQGALEDELGRGMYESHAKGAAGIVLDVDTGEVLALASLPAFNPNRIEKANAPNIFNRVTNQVYELGSTFKPITVASALDAGTVRDLGKRYQASRPLSIGGFQIRDSHALGASLNVPEALIHSSNIVTAQIADELGGSRLNETMRSLGFDERPYIELPARGFPLWPKGKWSRITTMTVSYGHGIAVTPMHLASGYASLVNGGIWRPATLQKLEPGEAPAGRRVFKASTSARMRQLLRMIVVHGTGKKADAPGFRVGGKTGSAEKPGAGGYKRSTLVSTFAAAFPMDRPRYVVLAMLDEPKGTVATSGQRTAAWNAAPVISRVVPRIGPLLGIMPDETRDVDISDLRPLIPGEARE